LCAHLAAKRIGIDVVDEGALPVDLHDGKPLTVLLLQLPIPADVDLLEHERDFDPGLSEDAPGSFAEVAALRVVENDLTDRCRA
jgi:hypothetical protein